MREPSRIQKYKLRDKDKFYNYYSDKRGLIMIRRKGFTTFLTLFLNYGRQVASLAS